MGYPFLFYGHRPAEWTEGANAGHFYELRFVRRGTPDELRAAAAAWVAALAGTPVVSVDWTFAGDWALVRCGEEIPSRGDTHFEQFFSGIDRAMRAVHAALPLAEVVMGNARGGGTSAWDDWSRSQQPWPSPYPAFDVEYTRFYGTTSPGYVETHGDEALGRGEKNAAFEEALHAAFAKQSVAETKKTAAKAKKAGKLAFEPIDAPLVEKVMAPVRAQYDRWKVRFEALGIPTARVRLETRSGRIVTMVEVAPRESRLAFADPNDTAARVFEATTFKGNVQAKLSPDETRLLVVLPDENVVVTCPTEGGAPSEVFRASTKRGLKDASWLDDARIVVSADKKLHVVTLGAAGAKVAGSFDAKSPSKVHPFRVGALLFVTSYDARADVYAVEGDTLRKLGGAAGEYDGLYELDGEFYTSGAPWCRIAGLP